MVRRGGIYRRPPPRVFWETRRPRPALRQASGTVALTLTVSATGAVGSAPVTGSGAVALVLGVTATGSVTIQGAGATALTLGASGAGSVTLQGAGSAALTLAVSGAGSASAQPVTGAGAVALALQVAASGSITVRGAAWLAFPFFAGGTGITTPLPPATVGWRLTYRAGPRWRIAWRPLVPTALFPVPVSPGNDCGVLLETVRGYELPSGTPVDYTGGSVVAHWATTPDSNTPLGGISGTFPRNATSPHFAVGFDAADMATVLTGLADGSALYLVLTGAGDFRTVIEHVVRTARVLP